MQASPHIQPHAQPHAYGQVYIHAQNLVKRHIVQGQVQLSLNDVSLAIFKGQVIGIIGPSGAGKSTLLRCLNTLEPPDSGQLFIDDQDVNKLKKTDLQVLRRKIGVIFQNVNLLQNKTVYENVCLPLALAKLPQGEQKEKAERILHLVGILNKRDEYPNQLSGGQKQRVAIARALVGNCKILLCDEFTSALDPNTTQDMITLLKKLQQKLGLTIVFVTHDMTVLKNLADYVFVLDQGRVVEQNHLELLISNPTHATTQCLLSDLFHDRLPDFLESKIKNNPIIDCSNQDVVLKLVFDYKNSTKPLMAMLTQKWGILPNIITGSLSNVSAHTYGHLVISFTLTDGVLQKVIPFLEENHVQVFPLGYISWNQ
jgi:D-methionine transport system ATP-binding protein